MILLMIYQSVRAYYECAFSRFVDNIGLSVQREMFAKLRNELKRWLVEKLGIEAANGKICRSYSKDRVN